MGYWTRNSKQNPYYQIICYAIRSHISENKKYSCLHITKYLNKLKYNQAKLRS